MTVTQNDISNAVISIGLSEKIIFLHSSLKSFGYVEGGARTVIKGFLAQNCTVVVTTYTDDAIVVPPEGKWIEQNGCDYSELPELKSADVVPYNFKKDMIAKYVGTVPAEVLKMEESVRGYNPINSLTAIGPASKAIIECQKPLDVYAPFRKIYEDGSGRPNNAFIVLAGVDLTKATAIHFAEQLSGRRLFRAWAKISETEAMEAELGSCSDGFNNLAGYVKAIEKNIIVGESLWRIFPFKEFIDIITPVIKANPLITHCADSHCLRCNDAIKGGPIL